MKYFVLLTILALSGYAVNAKNAIHIIGEQKIIALQTIAECSQQRKVAKEDQKELHRGKFENIGHNTKCFLNCFLEKYGFLIDGQEQSAVISKKLRRIIGVEKINVIMAKCIGLKGSDNCDTAFALINCYYNTNAAIV